MTTTTEQYGFASAQIKQEGGVYFPFPPQPGTLAWVEAVLRTATRIGADKDEPEGTRYIQISETLVNQMCEALRTNEHAPSCNVIHGATQCAVCGNNDIKGASGSSSIWLKCDQCGQEGAESCDPDVGEIECLQWWNDAQWRIAHVSKEADHAK